MNKTKLDPVRQRDILDQDYVSRKDLQDLYGWSKRQASKEFNEILMEQISMKKNIMYHGRTCLIPIDPVLDKYPLTYQKINRSANRIIKEGGMNE